MTTQSVSQSPQLEKMPTGIEGLDEITGGGLPRNRTTLVVGGPGIGKTVLALQTLINGVRQWGEPGIFVAFEENSRQILTNAASFGWDLPKMEATPLLISTIADTWIHLSYMMQGGERNRALTIIKSRGTHHSNQVRELILSDEGISLSDVYTSGGTVLMGTLRYEKEEAEREEQERLSNGILVTPTLVRIAPPPMRKILGNLNDREKVLLTLGLARGLP